MPVHSLSYNSTFYSLIIEALTQYFISQQKIIGPKSTKRYSTLNYIYYSIYHFCKFASLYIPTLIEQFKNQQTFNLNISNFLEITQQQIMKVQVSESNVANFVQKAFEIISNHQYSKIIQWSANGKEFTIKDIQQFQETILPKYFRHRNINSFIRQLNMYGFHKSRKEPTKNIFSHPFFQKDKPQLLCDVKRKIKLEENETPKKNPEPERSLEKITIYDKPTAQKEQARLVSNTSLAFKSSINLEKQFSSPVKGLISRSLIMDINPEICLRLRENTVLGDQENEQEDVLSIADEIIRERQRFNNRTQGISIVRTSNFIQEFQF